LAAAAIVHGRVKINGLDMSAHGEAKFVDITIPCFDLAMIY